MFVQEALLRFSNQLSYYLLLNSHTPFAKNPSILRGEKFSRFPPTHHNFLSGSVSGSGV